MYKMIDSKKWGFVLWRFHPNKLQVNVVLRTEIKQGMIAQFLPYEMSAKECEIFSIKWGQKKEWVKRQDAETAELGSHKHLKV